VNKIHVRNPVRVSLVDLKTPEARALRVNVDHAQKVNVDRAQKVSVDRAQKENVAHVMSEAPAAIKALKLLVSSSHSKWHNHRAMKPPRLA
jgi:hypothetical protein